MNLEIYSQLVSKSLPIIEAYHNDLLLHDYREIGAVPTNTPFLHFTCPCGTHLVILHAADSPIFPPKGEEIPYIFSTAPREKVVHGFTEVAEYAAKQSGETQLCLYFDGLTLREISKDESIVIARQHVRNVLDTWKN